MSSNEFVVSLAHALGAAPTPEQQAVMQAAFASAVRIAAPVDGALFDVEPSHHASLLARAAAR